MNGVSSATLLSRSGRRPDRWVSSREWNMTAVATTSRARLAAWFQVTVARRPLPVLLDGRSRV